MVTRDLLIKTAFNGMSCVFQGIHYSQKGPAFIDLINISGTDVQGGSVYITCSNITHMLGSFISGYLYSRVKLTSMTLAVALILTGLLLGATPWCTHFITMLLVTSANYVFVGVIDATVSTEQMRICQGDSSWAMQFLSFCYSLGGIIGPLITEPFLAPEEIANTTEKNVTFNYTHAPSNVDAFPNVSHMMSSKNRTLTLNQTPPSGGEKSNESDSGSTEYLIRYAFLITAVLGVVVSLPYVVQSFKSYNKEDKKEEGDASTPSSRKLPQKTYLIIVAIVFFYYFLFTAFEDSFIQYLSYFLVNHLDWSKEDGALLTAVYWIFSTCLKLALILLAKRIDNGAILLVSNIALLLSSLGFTVVCQLHVHSMVWVFTAIIASSVSALYGGAMAWVDSDLLQMDGKATASLVIAAALGGTVTPIPLGTMMKSWTTMAFAYLMFALSLLAILVIIILLFIIKPFIIRRYGPPRPDTEKEEALPETECTETANGVLLPRVPSHDNNTEVDRVTEEIACQI